MFIVFSLSLLAMLHARPIWLSLIIMCFTNCIIIVIISILQLLQIFQS